MSYSEKHIFADEYDIKPMKDIYVSLDEARGELARRWQDAGLKRRIEAELGERFMPSFKDAPRGVSFRQVCSPDNGFTFFYQCSRYIGAEPLVLEYHDDIFTHINEEKKGLGRLRVTQKDGTGATVDIMDFHANEKKKLGDVTIKTGEKLVDFHHNLFEVSGYKVDFLENSKWFHSIGKASEYYYYLLLHFISHGVLFENLEEGDEKQKSFAENLMVPEIVKIKEKFGLYPLIIRSYPDHQDDAEDLYWWSYPPHVNDCLVAYARDNDSVFKNIKL